MMSKKKVDTRGLYKQLEAAYFESDPDETKQNLQFKAREFWNEHKNNPSEINQQIARMKAQGHQIKAQRKGHLFGLFQKGSLKEQVSESDFSQSVECLTESGQEASMSDSVVAGSYSAISNEEVDVSSDEEAEAEEVQSARAAPIQEETKNRILKASTALAGLEQLKSSVGLTEDNEKQMKALKELLNQLQTKLQRLQNGAKRSQTFRKNRKIVFQSMSGRVNIVVKS